MAINRAIYENSFFIENIPSWNCPSCRKGILKGIEPDFAIVESKSSKDTRSDAEWEPEWINGYFTGKLICNNTECQETVLVLGRMSVKEEKKFNENGYWESQLSETFLPE